MVGVSDTTTMMRMKTLFRALLDHHDRGISHGMVPDAKCMDDELD
jgi:hypothetical protein